MRISVPNLSHYLRLGFGLVHIPPGTKVPRTSGWQDHPITNIEEAARVWNHGGGLGLHHAASRTAVLDIDHPEWAALALAAVDIDLGKLLTALGPKIRGLRGLSRCIAYSTGSSWGARRWLGKRRARRKR